MIPLALPIHPTDRPIHPRDPTGRNQNPAQHPLIPPICRRVDRQAHEDVARPIHDHQAVDHRLVRDRAWRLELEEGERVLRPDDGVDAEADEDGGEGAGGEAEVGGRGEAGGGGHLGEDGIESWRSEEESSYYFGFLAR